MNVWLATRVYWDTTEVLGVYATKEAAFIGAVGNNQGKTLKWVREEDHFYADGKKGGYYVEQFEVQGAV